MERCSNMYASILIFESFAFIVYLASFGAVVGYGVSSIASFISLSVKLFTGTRSFFLV
jgi:hypothetical protein